ncbi:winged helix-turn-helix transcriptional regulator [Patescibacteria group bacterium]|nr:winged helix-turn-helix transcriptional regulator [Patescibacteria group bacterium]
MNYILLIIVGIAGVIIGSYFGMPKGGSGNKNILTKQAEAKIENKQKILKFLKKNENLPAGKAGITNNDVEELCDVSNATAERYLDELENEGKIEQIGKTGKYTYYRLI